MKALGIHSSSSLLKAEIFKMPAMSPTMNEGGVTEWKFKEGDSFSSGDVLLEVETDKSQIDVEAQDDGILAKIIKGDGSKDIPVGEAIAIIAEPGDDLSTLELPDVSSGAAPKKEEPKPKKQEEPKKSEPSKKSSTPAPSGSVEANKSQTFSPSVASLLEANDISKEDALNKIQASGPNGRILKGDVLAYLGRISQDSVNRVSSFVNSHAKLDLSNIEKLKITPKETAKPAGKPEKPKKEIKIISETINLSSIEESVKSLSPESALNFDLASYVKEASKRSESFAYQRKAVSSDYYDPIFEDLVALPTNLERFKVDLNIQIAEKSPTFSGETSDFLDLLDSTPSTASESTVTVKVTVSPTVQDADAKANAYISKLKNYLVNPNFQKV